MQFRTCAKCTETAHTTALSTRDDGDGGTMQNIPEHRHRAAMPLVLACQHQRCI